MLFALHLSMNNVHGWFSQFEPLVIPHAHKNKCKNCMKKKIDITNRHELCKDCYSDLVAFGTLPKRVSV